MLKTRLKLGLQLEKLKKVQNDMKQRELKEFVFDQTDQLLIYIFALILPLAHSEMFHLDPQTPSKKESSLSEPKANSEERKQRVHVDIIETCSLMCLGVCTKPPPQKKRWGGG